jgi:hypothetical protein
VGVIQDILLNAYLIEPGSYTPKVNEMLDFNIWAFNSRVFPGIDPIVAGQATRCECATAISP